MYKKVYVIAFSFDDLSWSKDVLAVDVHDAEQKIFSFLEQEYRATKDEVKFSALNPWHIFTIEEYLKQHTALVM